MKELHNKNIDLIVDVHIDIKKNEIIENVIIETGKIFAKLNSNNAKDDIKKMRSVIDTLEKVFEK